MSTGGDALVAALRLLGVDVAFGLPGVHNLAAWEALSRSEIRLVGVRHEQTAAYAADGYARATGRLGVALTTTGPGAANTLAAVGEAWASRSPILVVATDIATTLRRAGVYRGVLHETQGQQRLFEPVTKATFVVERGEQLAAYVLDAGRLALRAPQRPVYLQIPTDLLALAVDGPERVAQPDPSVTDPVGPLGAAAALLAAAERPLLWVGGGAIRAGMQVAAVADALAAPIITTFQARGLLGADHPLAVGLPPHLPACGELWDQADVVLAVGSDFDGMMTQNWAQPPPSALVTVNIDAADAAKAYPPTLSLVGDAAAVLAALDVPDRGERARATIADDLRRRRTLVRDQVAGEQPAAAEFLDQLAQVLPEQAVVVADMCIPGYWYAALGRVGGPRRLAYPVGWGTLGFAFPASLGAAAAAAITGLGPVVCLCGDGGFLFAAGELATLAQERLPLTVVIVDDGGYGMLRYDQKHAGQTLFGVDLHTPDFAALAAAFGVRSESVNGLGAEFGAALGRHILDSAPSVLVAKAALDPPPTTSPRWYRHRA